MLLPRIGSQRAWFAAVSCGIAASVGGVAVFAYAIAARRRRRRFALEEGDDEAKERHEALSDVSTSSTVGKEANASDEHPELVEMLQVEPALDLEDVTIDTPALPRAGVHRRGNGKGKPWPRFDEERSGKGGLASTASTHLPGRQRVYVKTFGCPHNQSDGEYLMGLLKDYGYSLVDNMEECDACVVNSCTVKAPSETRAMNLVENAQSAGKRVVLTGCVASSDRKLVDSLQDVSVLDVSQYDRIVDVVEESIKGHSVKLLEKRKDLISLALPKVRKDKFAEIIPINMGCLGNCTYCKTKLARGKVVSHPVDQIVARAKQVAAEGVCQIELASEDMGAYGVDIGTNIVELLLALSDALPPNVMLRTGMTNPPFILAHVDGIIEALNRPNVFAFMHIPVQSGSDKVLQAMRREYTVGEFSYLVDRLKESVPDMFLLTDIICGFPAESPADWEESMELARKYKFHGIHISQFYARPNTPAAHMKPLKSHIGKQRWIEMNDLTNAYNRNEIFEGREERVWFNATQKEHNQTVGRNKAFAKVVVPRDDALLGRSALVQIDETNKQHLLGHVTGGLQ